MLPKEQDLPHLVLRSHARRILGLPPGLPAKTLNFESLESATVSINCFLCTLTDVSLAQRFQNPLPHGSPVPGHNVSPGLIILRESCFLLLYSSAQAVLWCFQGEGHQPFIFSGSHFSPRGRGLQQWGEVQQHWLPLTLHLCVLCFFLTSLLECNCFTVLC